MPERSISQLVSDIKADTQALAQEEAALAKAQATAGAKNLGIGSGLAIAGLFLLFLSAFMAIFTIAAVFHEALGLSWWLSFLIVFAILVVLAAILVLIAIPLFKKGNPTPTKAIDGAKSAVDALKRAVKNPSGPRINRQVGPGRNAGATRSAYSLNRQPAPMPAAASRQVDGSHAEATGN